MELSALVIFALALAIAAGSPGPSIAALIARVLMRGWRDVAPFVLAMWLGEALWLTLAVLGLAALAETFHWAFVAVKWCGVAYLLWLAWQMWRAPVAVTAGGSAPRAGRPARMFLAGLAVTLGNPKIMAFYLAVLPTIIDLGALGALGLLELALTMLVVLAGVDIAWIALAERARRLLASPRALQVANRVGATLMGGAAAAIAAR